MADTLYDVTYTGPEIQQILDRVYNMPSGTLATQTWVQSQGYITASALNGYATQTWVQNQGYITASALNGYATQTWVNTQLGSYLAKSGGTMTGQLGSSVATGTAPISVTSTTLCPNLNADMLDGKHLNELFTELLSGTMYNLTITVGGVQKRLEHLYAWKTDQLRTARSLWGNSFNGTEDLTGNITISTGTYLQIGDIRLAYDQANNALQVVKADGTAANFYATGGVSALGMGSGGGGGISLNEPLASINAASLGTPSGSNKVLLWNGSAWAYSSLTSGSVTSITAGTGLSGGTITSSGTIAISSTYQTYISHGQAAYGWGNHANAGYATQDWVQSQGYLTASSFSAFSAVDEKLSITIGSTTRAVQAPTIADLGVNAESASSSSTPSVKFQGVKLGTKTGLYMTRLYDSATPPSATPVNYGNIINIIGGGGGQILAQWQGSYDTGHLFYRSHRDTTSSGGWTPWKKIAFTDDAVASADKLTTARTLWGQQFNGTANVTGNMTSVGSIAASGEIKTSNGNAFRLSYGNVGTILRSDSTSFHVLFTDSGSADAGTWNSLRPLSINKTSGIVRMENGLYIYNANQPNANNDGFNALRIGNAVLSWDSTNNALKVSKYDGTAVNFYSLGGVSALGFSNGVNQSISVGTLTANTLNTQALNMANESRIYTDESLYIGSPNSDGWVYLADCCSQQGDSYWLIGEDGHAVFNAYVRSPKFYLDNTRYLQYSGGHLQFYNGSSFINLT